MLKLVELGNYHSSKGGLFDMVSDRVGILEILFIDENHKTNVYDLSLFVTTVIDSLGISVHVGLWLLLQKIHHQLRVILII